MAEPYLFQQHFEFAQRELVLSRNLANNTVDSLIAERDSYNQKLQTTMVRYDELQKRNLAIGLELEACIQERDTLRHLMTRGMSTDRPELVGFRATTSSNGTQQTPSPEMVTPPPSPSKQNSPHSHHLSGMRSLSHPHPHPSTLFSRSPRPPAIICTKRPSTQREINHDVSVKRQKLSDPRKNSVKGKSWLPPQARLLTGIPRKSRSSLPGFGPTRIPSRAKRSSSRATHSATQPPPELTPTSRYNRILLDSHSQDGPLWVKSYIGLPLPAPLPPPPASPNSSTLSSSDSEDEDGLTGLDALIARQVSPPPINPRSIPFSHMHTYSDAVKFQFDFHAARTLCGLSGAWPSTSLATRNNFRWHGKSFIANGRLWNMEDNTVSLPCQERLELLAKVGKLLQNHGHTMDKRWVKGVIDTLTGLARSLYRTGRLHSSVLGKWIGKSDPGSESSEEERENIRSSLKWWKGALSDANWCQKVAKFHCTGDPVHIVIWIEEERVYFDVDGKNEVWEIHDLKDTPDILLHTLIIELGITFVLEELGLKEVRMKISFREMVAKVVKEFKDGWSVSSVRHESIQRCRDLLTAATILLEVESVGNLGGDPSGSVE